MSGSYLGPRFGDEEIQAFLDTNGCVARRVEKGALAEEVASHLAREKVVGLLQGRMEFGPRALGGRSIIGDPRSPDDAVDDEPEDQVPRVVPAVRAVRASRARRFDWFDLDGDSPYMLLVADVREDRRLPVSEDANAVWGIEKLNIPRSTIPAVTHVDYSARIQTVRRETTRSTTTSSTPSTGAPAVP